MIRIHGEILGQAAFDRAFLKVEHVLNDFRRVFDDLGELVLEWNEDQFQTAGAAGGTPWEPLTADYAGWKAEHSKWGSFVDISILRLTDHMYFSLTKKGAADNVWRVDALEAEFGSLDPKAGWHHSGAGRLKARQIIVTNEQRKTQMMKRAQKALIDELKETGLVQRTMEF